MHPQSVSFNLNFKGYKFKLNKSFQSLHNNNRQDSHCLFFPLSSLLPSMVCNTRHKNMALMETNAFFISKVQRLMLTTGTIRTTRFNIKMIFTVIVHNPATVDEGVINISGNRCQNLDPFIASPNRPMARLLTLINVEEIIVGSAR